MGLSDTNWDILLPPTWTPMWQQQQRPLLPQQQREQQHQQHQTPEDYFYPSNANYNPSHGNSNDSTYGKQYTNNDAAGDGGANLRV